MPYHISFSAAVQKTSLMKTVPFTLYVFGVYTHFAYNVRNQPAKHLNSLTSYSVVSFSRARARTTTGCVHMSLLKKKVKRKLLLVFNGVLLKAERK